MRQLSILAAVLLGAIAAPVHCASPDLEVLVTAHLVSVNPAPGCGIFILGSPASYEVIAGPEELVNKEIHVLVDCIEIPRVAMGPDSGDLKTFEIGAVHYLAISKKNIRNLAALPTDGIWFYLRAASLNELRPNKSLERTSDP